MQWSLPCNLDLYNFASLEAVLFNSEELGSLATEKPTFEFWFHLLLMVLTLESPRFYIYKIQVVIVPSFSKIVMNKKEKKKKIHVKCLRVQFIGLINGSQFISSAVIIKDLTFTASSFCQYLPLKHGYMFIYTSPYPQNLRPQGLKLPLSSLLLLSDHCLT